MTYYERVDELRDGANFTAENYETEYLTAEIVLIDLFGEYIKGAEIISKPFGTGKVVSTSGDTLDQMFMEVAFTGGIKKLGVMPVITGKVVFTKFADILEVGDAWDHAFDLHTDMTRKVTDYKKAEQQREVEAENKAKAAKKAEEQYQRTKAKAIKDFEELTTRVYAKSTADEFYYSLGWLANNTTSFSAALPDYLLSSFEKQFGTEAKPTVVDSTKRTVNGFPMQWALSMKASIKKAALELIPNYLTEYLGKAGNAITDTSFVWDLVDNYGFQFGKKQDIEKIKQTIPATYMISFEAGLTA